jgi:O-acetyl-ADP-ribose deacetylase (regulator of RNase III)
MEIKNADILNCKSGLIIHGTNCSGGFGSGIAGQIRVRFPKVLHEFQKMPHGEVSLGKLQIVSITDDLYIGNAFTQLNFGGDGKRYASLDAIATVLEVALEWCTINQVALNAPKIGCGLGGLSWDADVAPIFKEYSDKYPQVEITIYECDK